MNAPHYPVCPTPPTHVPDGYVWIGVCDPGPAPWWQVLITIVVIIAALGFLVLIGGRR